MNIFELVEKKRLEIESLRAWIKDEGLRTNVCTKNILGEICDNCARGGDDVAVDEAEAEYKKLLEIEAAALNLVKVKGRHNTEIAMNRLTNILRNIT